MDAEVWSKSDIGLVRQSNQDALGCFPEIGLFIVADGMGGHAGGDIASRLAVEVIHDYFRELPAQGTALRRLRSRARRVLPSRQDPPNRAVSIPEALRAAVERSNLRILQTAESVAGGRTMGTTVVVLKLALAERQAYWAHVGDSRLYLLREGDLSLLTADHTVFGEPYVGQPSIPLDLPHTSRLLQALGVQHEVHITLGSDVVKPGDVFLLCSDGLSGLVGSAVVREQLAKDSKLADAGTALIRLALEAGGTDNTSLVLVRLLSP